MAWAGRDMDSVRQFGGRRNWVVTCSVILDFLVHGPVESVIAAGYKFGVANEAIATVLIGTGNVPHLEENVAAILGPPITAEDRDASTFFSVIWRRSEREPGKVPAVRTGAAQKRSGEICSYCDFDISP